MKNVNGDKPKVLMVDSNIQNLILLKSILNKMDLDFFVSTNGEDALKKIHENKFDLIFLETILPDNNGYAICRLIKEDKKKCDAIVILLSSFTSNEDKTRGFESGADDYLIKPLSRNEVLSRVQLHLEKLTSIKHMKRLLKHSYHELYNPLAVIESSVEMYELYNEENKYVNAMHAAAKSLHVIYEDLYYSLSPSKAIECIENINLHDFLRERIAFFSLLAEIRGIEFILNSNENLFVFMSGVDLQRIVDNTLSNAIKYAFECSSIIITLIYNNGIELSISNQGNEIKCPDRIFTDGYREAYEKNGMGIGLEIVSSICHKQKINTIVYSKKNITTFTYTFQKDNENENNING